MALDTADTVTGGSPPRAEAPGAGASGDAIAAPESPVELDVASRRRFGASASIAAILLGLFLIWMASHPGDHRSTTDIDSAVKLAAATLAAASCFVAGRRASPQTRPAWMWTGAFATVWAIGAGVLTWYDFARNRAVPFPSAADAGFLLALPLAAIGALLSSSVPGVGVSRARMLLDGIIVAGSLLIVSWATALGTVYHSGSGSVFSQAVGLAYPIGDVIVATVAITVLAQGRGRQRLPLVLLVAGLLCLTVGDSSLAYLGHLTSFRYGTLVDSSRVGGFLLVALAPLWPQERTTTTDEVEGPSPWQVALPYLFVALAIFAAVLKGTQSSHVDLFDLIDGLCVMAAVLTRLVLALVENLRLTSQMRHAVTTLRANQVELVHYALHDSLTGLPNRVLFGDRIEHALARRSSPTRRVAVMLCDLDSFKDVNDTLGHPSGDEVLIAAADRLSSCVRPADTVARIGGDEFAILIDDASGVDEVASVAARVCTAMRAPFTVAGRDFIVQVSVGIAMANQYDTRSEKLLQDADVALYATKDAGGNDYTFFEPRLGKAYVDRLGLQAELSAALDKGELFMEYQPVVELASGRTVGVEALLRWRHPRRGVLKPVDFLPVAENSGLAVQIGTWALGEALQQLRGWRERTPAAARLWTAVNVSARQLASGDLVSAVSKAIEASGLEPESLHVELTESAVIDLVDWSLVVLRDLKKLGAALEIDDFGTGYSSLAYLKQLPIDGVKIDRVFVDGLGTDGRDAVIIEAVVSLAHALQLKVAAAGVETSRQLEWLRTLGCDYGQGFQWSSPLSAAELERWLTRN
ncbi:MAG: putative bifunctional diguanylate cyclase/phosphodiesterase [Acidimicrobiales bacterium]